MVAEAILVHLNQCIDIMMTHHSLVCFVVPLIHALTLQQLSPPGLLVLLKLPLADRVPECLLSLRDILH